MFNITRALYCQSHYVNNIYWNNNVLNCVENLCALLYRKNRKVKPKIEFNPNWPSNGRDNSISRSIARNVWPNLMNCRLYSYSTYREQQNIGRWCHWSATLHPLMCINVYIRKVEWFTIFIKKILEENFLYTSIIIENIIKLFFAPYNCYKRVKETLYILQAQSIFVSERERETPLINFTRGS